MRTRLLALTLLALAAAPAGATADSWTRTGSMTAARVFPTATRLPNGQVLVAGGNNGANRPESQRTSERYDPVSGQWLGTPSFDTERDHQAASLLPDGRVLMTGGYRVVFPDPPAIVSSAVAFDPVSNSWTSVAGMPHAHGFHTQVTLPDGHVLVFGGFSSYADFLVDGADDQIELYDPATSRWTTGPFSPYFMANGTTTLLADGRVLVAGGSSSDTNRAVAMRYDPATNRWRVADRFADARRDHVAALLPDGKVLIAGGEGDGGRALRTASIYDPTTNRWTETVPMATARERATATLLPNGKVLVAGGTDGSAALATAELYDPTAGSWAPATTMAATRTGHTATLLSDGRVLIAGGSGRESGSPSSGGLRSAEIYTPDGWPFTRGGGGGGGTGGGGTGGGGPGAGTGGGPGGSGASGTPSISGLTLSATRFRAAGSGPSVTAARRRRAPVGTTIAYRDGATATATFVVQRPAAGRRAGGRCARPTRANRRHARCTRWLTVGRFTHADAAGPNTFHFSGRVAGHKLAPGRYRLSVSARIGRGTPSSAQDLDFRIVR